MKLLLNRDYRPRRSFAIRMLLAALSLCLGDCLLDCQITTPALFAQDLDEDFEIATTANNGGLEFLNESSIPKSIEQLRAMEKVFADVIESVAPATVNIAVGQAQGSGVVVSRDGYVLTAAHVITRPNLDATITFPDGSKVSAITLGVNPRADSGMLKITDEGKWPFLDIGESAPLERGQWVMAIGHPGGLTEGRGLVYRAGRIVSLSETVITSDCTLVGGDSGGPLVDLSGYVIGIHSRIGGRLTQNHHVPVDRFSIDWDQFASSKIVGIERAYLGVEIDRENLRIVKIVRVLEREGAGKGGMKSGDVVIKVNDIATTSQAAFRRAMKKLKPNDVAKFVVKRGDEEVELEITLGYHHVE